MSTAQIKNKRNLNLDLVRLIGLFIIMVAHSDPPFWIFQLRNFGTPLLILGSALTYGYIYRYKNLLNRKLFYKKRLERLVIPAWFFLGFFFLFFYLIFIILDETYPFNLKIILGSFSFYYGIGFVWILKVYIILALLTPICLKYSKSTVSNQKYFSSIFLFYCLYEFFVYLYMDKIPIDYSAFVKNSILVIIPYSAIYLYGLRVHLINDKVLFCVTSLSLTLFLVLVFWKFTDSGKFVPTQNYKTPPRFYYLAYAFFCINMVYYFVVRRLKLSENWIYNLIFWMSSNSLWIYFWHIMAFYLWAFFIENSIGGVLGVYMKFFIRVFFLFGFGILLTYLQTVLVEKMLPKSKPNVKRVLLLLK